MNTEVTVRDDAPLPKPMLQTGGPIEGLVPRSIEEVFRLANAVVQAGMAPYGMDTPQKVTISILTGLEVGMPPMQAVQSIAVIGNRPCMWGDGLLATVRKSTLCLYVKEWVEGEGDKRVAYCETHRKGEKEPILRSYSVDDAKSAGLWQTKARVSKRRKDGSSYETDNDSPWFKHQKRMLQMRARGYCLRDTYPDVLKGMQMREEMEDHHGPERAKDVTPARPSLVSRLQAKGAEPTRTEGFSREHVDAETGEVLDQVLVDANEDNQIELAPDADEPDAKDAEEEPGAEHNDDDLPEEQTLLEKGEAAAVKGVSALLQWRKNLNDAERAEIKPHLDKLSAAAKLADGAAA